MTGFWAWLVAEIAALPTLSVAGCLLLGGMSGSAGGVGNGAQWFGDEAVPDNGTPEQWFRVLQPLRLGLGVRVGWHYTRADLYSRLPVDAPDPVTGRAALDAFVADPTHAHLLPVANTWSTWPSPMDAEEYGRQPIQTLLMGLIVAHSNWGAWAEHMTEFGCDSDDRPEADLGGLSRAEVGAMHRLAASVVSQVTTRAALAGFPICAASHDDLRREAFQAFSALQEEMSDADFARRGRQDELWR